MNGLQAVTQNFVAAQTYPGADAGDRLRRRRCCTSSATAANYASYFRDIVCGNTANPTSGPDGDAATKGWDAATGWGEPDWFNFSTGYAHAARRDEPERAAVALAGTSRGRCAKTPSNSTERAFSCPIGVDLLRGRHRLGRHAVVRQVPRRAAPGAR